MGGSSPPRPPWLRYCACVVNLVRVNLFFTQNTEIFVLETSILMYNLCLGSGLINHPKGQQKANDESCAEENAFQA